MLSKKVENEFTKWCDTDIKGGEFKFVLECLKYNNIRGLIPYLQLYFDSVGIVIEIQVHTEPTMQGARFKKFRPEILANRTFNNVGASFGERKRAWAKAIERANELRNEQLKTN